MDGLEEVEQELGQRAVTGTKRQPVLISMIKLI
jgi:hypothetical protein